MKKFELTENYKMRVFQAMRFWEEILVFQEMSMYTAMSCC